MKKPVFVRVLASVLAGAAMLLTANLPTAQPHSSSGPFVYGPQSRPHGESYAEWSAHWWRWVMEHPMTDHPATEQGTFDIASGQSGDVWYLATPLLGDATSTVTRSGTVPAGKGIFLALVAAEWSNLEGGAPTAQEQRDLATWQADHILPGTLSVSLDGQSLANPANFRFVSSQFDFDAPTPWLFGDVGGAGESVGDGYYVFLRDLSPGQHTLHYTGQYQFTLANDGFDYDAYVDTTYVLTQL